MRRTASDVFLMATEAEYQDLIVDYAILNGWWVYHTHDSRRSQAGFPDLVLIRPPRVIFLEVKRERGKLRPEQAKVLGMLALCTELEARHTRPSDWPDVQQLLMRAGAGREEMGKAAT